MQNPDDILVQRLPGHHRVVLNRPDRKNTLTPDLVGRILDALVSCEKDGEAKALLLEGRGGCFCNGMDLAEAGNADGGSPRGGEGFAHLMARFAVSDVVVVAKVEGQARGGGLGLMAACDFVFADACCEFSLPELLWGLVPCTIAPFLIRRIGHRACRQLALSTLAITAAEAQACGLVDSLDPQSVPKLLRRLHAVPREAIGRTKRYLQSLWPVDDRMLDRAVNELDLVLSSADVTKRLRQFALTGRFPWERGADTR